MLALFLNTLQACGRHSGLMVTALDSGSKNKNLIVGVTCDGLETHPGGVGIPGHFVL